MPIKSSDVIGFPTSKLGIRVNLGTKVPDKLTEENLYQLFKDIFFYATKGLYIEDSMLANTNYQIIDDSTYFLTVEDLEERGIPIENILKEYETKFPSFNGWDIHKKWFGLVIAYTHFLLERDETKTYLLPTIELLLDKENDEVDYETLIDYANALNLSVSLFGKEYLIPRFSSLLNIKSDLYEEIFEDNLTLFFDYQKELMDIMKKHITVKDLDALYTSKYYNKWYSFYDEMFEDLYRFNQSSIIFTMSNLSDEDIVDLADVLMDDLFASFSTVLDIEDEKLNDLIVELADTIVDIFKNNYKIITQEDNAFQMLMQEIQKEFQTK